VSATLFSPAPPIAPTPPGQSRHADDGSLSAPVPPAVSPMRTRTEELVHDVDVMLPGALSLRTGFGSGLYWAGWATDRIYRASTLNGALELAHEAALRDAAEESES